MADETYAKVETLYDIQQVLLDILWYYASLQTRWQ